MLLNSFLEVDKSTNYEEDFNRIIAADRNKKDYTKTGIPIYNPIEFWNLLKNDDVNDIY